MNNSTQGGSGGGYEGRSTVILEGFVIASLIMQLIALTTSLLFKQQRKFPTSVVAWIAAHGVAYNLEVIIFIGLSGTDALYKDPLAAVAIIFVGEVFFLVSGVMISSFLAFTVRELFLKSKVMSTKSHPSYRRSMVILYWVFTVGWALGIGLTPPQVTPPPLQYFIPASVTPVAVLFCFCMLLILFQVFCFIQTFQHMFKISKRVKTQLSERELQRRKKDYWMCLRFLFVVVLQLFHIIPIIIWFNLVLTKPSSTTTVQIWLIVSFSGDILQSIVIMISNRTMRRWIKSHLLKRENPSSELSSEKPTGPKTPRPLMLLIEDSP